MREETPRSSSGFWVRLELRLVRRAVMPFDFKWSTSRVIIDRTSWGFPSAMKSVMGSMTATEGLKSRMARRLAARCISRPKSDGRAASIRRSPFFTNGARSTPIERMLRRSCGGDSSKAKNMHRSPRLQAENAGYAAMLVFPVPAEPETSTVLPRKSPFPPRSSSSASLPLEIRSVETSCASPSEVIGMTMIPRSPMRNGYSSPLCAEPLYFTTRMVRVATWWLSWTLRLITQSLTYSSRPWRVSVPSPCSPVMTTVTPFSFSQRKSRRSSARRMAKFVSPEKSDSMVSSSTRFAPMDSMACARRTKSPSRLYSPVSSISCRSTETYSTASLPCATSSSRSNPNDFTLVASSAGLSSKETTRPGSPNCTAPRTTNSSPSTVFPHPARPETRVGRPRGSPPCVNSSRPEIPVGAFGSVWTGRRLGAFANRAPPVRFQGLPRSDLDTRSRLHPAGRSRGCPQRSIIWERFCRVQSPCREHAALIVKPRTPGVFFAARRRLVGNTGTGPGVRSVTDETLASRHPLLGEPAHELRELRDVERLAHHREREGSVLGKRLARDAGHQDDRDRGQGGAPLDMAEKSHPVAAPPRGGEEGPGGR